MPDRGKPATPVPATPRDTPPPPGQASVSTAGEDDINLGSSGEPAMTGRNSGRTSEESRQAEQ